MKIKNIELADISRYRGELMGAAMLFIILFHVQLPRSDMFFGLRRMGNIGVDLFLFLSGIGLWFSWMKDRKGENLRQKTVGFYLRRLLRIYPTWLVMASLFYVGDFMGAGKYSKNLADLLGDVLVNWDFWLHDELTFWYIPATMMLYLLAPPYMELIRRHPVYRWLPVVMVMWCVIVQWVTPIHQAVGHIEIFWSRVPIFCLGINMAEAIRTKTRLTADSWIFVIAAFVFSLGACVWLEQMRHGRFPLYTERMLYIVLAITTIIIMSEVFDKLSAIRGINKAIGFVGGISLEIYLLHVEYVLKPLQHAYHLSYWPRFFATLAISVPVAWIISKVCSLVINRVKH
jgi:peptidoglycan/LPS O-acetylase OafA/YrhL